MRVGVLSGGGDHRRIIGPSAAEGGILSNNVSRFRRKGERPYALICCLG